MSSVQVEELLQQASAHRAKAMHVRYLARQIGNEEVIQNLLRYAATLDHQAAALEEQANSLRQAGEAAIIHADDIASKVAETRQEIDQLREDLSQNAPDPYD